MSFIWFFGSGETPLQERPELGTSHASPLSSYQLDRALLEKDVKKLNAEMGVQMLEGSEVDDIKLNSEDGLHEVRVLEKATKRYYIFKWKDHLTFVFPHRMPGLSIFTCTWRSWLVKGLVALYRSCRTWNQW